MKKKKEEPAVVDRSTCHGRPDGAAGHEPIGHGQLKDICRYCHRRISNVLSVWMLEAGEPEIPEEPAGRLVFIDAAGQITNCDRCGEHCRVAEKRNPESKPFRLSEKPRGVCANCVMTQFLYNTYPINMQIDEAGPELLLKPGIREAFLSSGLLDGCDLNIGEVNWAKVVANWDMPIAIYKDPRNPYRMGESPRSHKNRNKQKDPPPDPFVEKWRPFLAQHDGVLSGDTAREFMEESGLRALLDQAKGPVQ